MTAKYLVSIILSLYYCTVAHGSTTGAPTRCGIFQLYQFQHQVGATAEVGITAQADCEQFCVNDGTCRGYEWDRTTGNPPCWIHRGPIDLLTLYDDPLINLYLLTGYTPCTSSAESSPGVTVSETFSTTTTPLPTAGACATFNDYVGQHALGAQPIASATTRQLCLDNCILTPRCTAYEWTTATNVQFRCWFHYDTVIRVPDDLYNDDPTITISIINRFPCTPAGSGASDSTTSATTVTTTRGGGTGIGNCFQSLANTNALFAQQFTEARSDADCRTICVGQGACTAYETDNLQGFRCWLHLEPLGELFNTNGVTINIRISCETTSTISTVSGGPGQCVVFGPPLIDTQSIGALPRGSITDDACMTLCRNDATCVAYEIDNVLPDRCWTHHDAANLAVVYDTQFVNQYRVLSRECVTSVSTTTGSTTTTPTIPSNCAFYNQLNQTQSVGATEQLGVTSADACRNICTTNARCVAYELDTDPNNVYCWIHTDATTLLTLYDAPTVTQFQVVSRDCSTGSTASSSSQSTVSTVSGTGSTASVGPPTTTTPQSGSCQFSWDRIDNVNAPGGTPNRATDLPSCQDACTRNLYCVGVDVNSNNGLFFCYLITVDVPLTPFPGNTHYTLRRSAGCPTGPPTAPPTTTPATVSTVEPSTGCTWFRVIVGYNADGGILIGRMTRQDCLIRCVGDPSCFAVDFVEVDQTCFTHTSLAGAQLATCCVRYECASTPCTEDYVRYTDRSPSLGLGEVQNSVTTVQACQAACATKNCSRFSFVNAARIPSQSCYLFYANTAATGRDPVTVQVGIDLYVRKRCIQSPVLPPTTTVTPPPSLPPNYCPIDLVFIIDSSGSIRDNQPPGVDNWALIKAFVKDIIQTYLSIGPQTDHVSIITFSDNAVLNFDLNRYMDLNSILNAVDNLPFIGYETNTPAGLTIAEQVFTSSARNRSSKFAVLVTDGVVSPQWQSQYEPAINRLNQIVRSRYAIGVTTQISLSELYLYTGNRDAVTTVLSFSDLNKVREGLGTFINAVDCDGNSLLTSPLTTTGPTLSGSVSTVSGSGSVSSGSTATATTTTTTVATTTPEPRGGEGTFGALTRTSTTGRADPLTFPTLLANRNNVYITSTDSYVSTAVSGFYFIEICAGMISGTTAEVATRGAYPPLAFVWQSTAHNGVVSNCRSGVLSMTRGVRVYLQQLAGGVSSNNDVQTSWSMFSITDAIRSPLSVLSAVHRQPVTAPAVIPFINPTANPPGQYDPSSYQYLCGSSGVFFFSFSAGVPGGQTAALRLVGLANVFEITSASTTQNSVISIDRAVVAQCSSGRVRVQVTAGQITPGGSNQNLISFQAFPYQLPVEVVSASWGLYRSTSLSANSAATDPLPFDVAEVTQSVTYSNNAITLTQGGYYYTYMSCGCPAGQRCFLTLRRNAQTLYSIQREATNDNGVQTLGHGMVVLFQTGDVLKVVNEANSAIFSSSDGLHTSFVGIRLYAS